MSQTADELGLYLHLARASELRRRLLVRDRLLVLAAALASRMELERIAAYCRDKILQHNPHHLLGRWPSLRAAWKAEEFLVFLRQLMRRYPREKAERMLDTLGIQLAEERQTYDSVLEYAAAIMGTTPQDLQEMYGKEDG